MLAVLRRLQRSNYRILGLVGQGQFGQVYCAIHRRTGKLVALKNISRERLTTHRFLRELRFLLSLEHPNIANCRALEQSATGRRLVLDYCEAGTLRQLMDQDMALTLAELLSLTCEILIALDHAHTQGIVHCDVKPENILLSLTPIGWQVKISDFGIARLSQEIRGNYSGATGSPAYMAPERFYHQHSIASDLYAVGIILFELLVGDRPFTGTPNQLMVAHLNQSVKIPEAIPESLQAVLRKALQKLAGRRFQSAAEMSDAIAAARKTLTAGDLRQRLPLSFMAPTTVQFKPQPKASLCTTTQRRLTHLLVSQASSVAPMPSGTCEQLWLGDDGACVGAYPLTSDAALQAPAQTWQLSGNLRKLACCKHGAIAATDQTVYWLAKDGSLLTLATFPEPVSVSFSRNYRWLLAASDPAVGGRFWVLPLKPMSSQVMPHPKTLPVLADRHINLIMPDDQHLLVMAATDTQTQCHVLTRRGHYLGQLGLNTSIRRLVLAQQPLRLLAQGDQEGNGLLILDLKPFRVLRCRLDIVSSWLGELAAGFVGISEHGALRLVNGQGQVIGGVDGLPPPSAIAFQPPHHFWLATTQSDGAHLHRIDLRDLGLDIIF